ncbi:tRNA (adenosine(37)-N6)-dimethylallyltransferase MiaA [Clostridiaceae bacterium HSG29]|nr:tRNA (adenosine(37)-N6)-dimethylallyltransferase MiaA [Clostridiaceae bacterium HSG29]
MNKNVLIIAGPTAVGKTDLSLKLAKDLNGEIISADSVQIYKGMDIGSATPSEDELSTVKHHFINEINPEDEYSVAVYAKKAKEVIKDIQSRGKFPIVVGGTGLYVNSLIYEMDFSETVKDEKLRAKLMKEASIEGVDYIHNKLRELDPEAADKIHKNNLKRVIRALEINILTGDKMGNFKSDPVKTTDYAPLLVCLKRNRKLLYVRINRRVDIMLENGLIEEVKKLKERGLDESFTSMKAIGYKEVLGYLNDKYDLEMLKSIIKKNTRHFAKRQLTWFRRYDDAMWIDLDKDEFEESYKKIVKTLKNG